MINPSINPSSFNFFFKCLQLNILVLIVKRFSLFLSVILPNLYRYISKYWRQIKPSTIIPLSFFKIECHLSKNGEKKKTNHSCSFQQFEKYFWLKIDMPSVLLIIDTTIADRNHKSTETLMNYHFQPVKGQT